MVETKKKMSTETMILGALLSALVIILQLMGSFIRFGPFSISLVLIPIVIGSATCGTKISTWLGFVFGVTVLLSGDAALFMAVDIPGTIITVLLKGIACGFFTGLTYNAIEKHNKYLAVSIAAIVCPLVNTGVFLLGCLVFFMETVAEWAGAAGLAGNVGKYMIVGLVGFNFVFELGTNIVLSPVVLRLLNVWRKNK